MMKFIRWQGCIVFIAFITLFCAALWAGLPWVIKNSLQWTGSNIAGAEVNIANVNLALSPFRIEIDGVQVTDVDQPKNNIVQFRTASATVEFIPLLFGDVLINDLSILDWQFDTAREVPGEVLRNQTELSSIDSEEDADSSTDDMFDQVGDVLEDRLPSVDDILAREPLQTVIVSQRLQENYQQTTDQLTEINDTLPSEQQLADYQRQLKLITEGEITDLKDFQRRKQQLDELRKSLKQHRQDLNQARDTLGKSVGQIKQDLADLKDAPKNDVDRLVNKYQLNSTGAINVIGLLFGNQSADQVRRAYGWYQKISPYLGSNEDSEVNDDSNKGDIEEPTREAGRFIDFAAGGQQPKFLIRRLEISALLDGHSIDIKGKDITHESDVIDRPIVVNVLSEQNDSAASLNARVLLDRRNNAVNDDLRIEMLQWPYRPSNNLLDSAVVDVDLTASVMNKSVTSDVVGEFNQVIFNQQRVSAAGGLLDQSLKNISRFNIRGGIEGELSSPNVNLASDLDKQLTQAVTKIAKNRAQEFSQTLERQLMAKVQPLNDDYSAKLADIMTLDTSVNEKLNNVSGLLEQRLADFQEQKKNQIKSKVKDNLKNQLNKFF